MTKYIFILFHILIVFTHSCLCYANEACPELEQRIIQDRIRSIEQARPELEKILADFIAAGGHAEVQTLKEGNTPYEVLVIKPIPNSHPVNDVAHFLFHERSQIKLVFENLRSSRGHFYAAISGMFSEKNSALWIPKEALFSSEPRKDPTLRHEMVHADSYHYRRIGRDDALHGVVESLDRNVQIPSFSSVDYVKFKSFEELRAMRVSLLANAEQLLPQRNVLEKWSKENRVRDFHIAVSDSFASARALESMARQTLEVVGEVRKSLAMGKYQISLNESGYVEFVTTIVGYGDFYGRKEIMEGKRGRKIVPDSVQVKLIFPQANHIEVFKQALATQNNIEAVGIVETRLAQLEKVAQDIQPIADRAHKSFVSGLELIDPAKTNLNEFFLAVEPLRHWVD